MNFCGGPPLCAYLFFSSFQTDVSRATSDGTFELVQPRCSTGETIALQPRVQTPGPHLPFWFPNLTLGLRRDYGHTESLEFHFPVGNFFLTLCPPCHFAWQEKLGAPWEEGHGSYWRVADFPVENCSLNGTIPERGVVKGSPCFKPLD